MQMFMYCVSRVRHANNKIRTMAEHPETSKTAVHARHRRQLGGSKGSVGSSGGHYPIKMAVCVAEYPHMRALQCALNFCFGKFDCSTASTSVAVLAQYPVHHKTASHSRQIMICAWSRQPTMMRGRRQLTSGLCRSAVGGGHDYDARVLTWC